MGSRALARKQLIAVSAALAAMVGFPGAALAESLEVVGKSNLGGGGLNGQVATVGNIAVVGAGVLPGQGARSGYYTTYPCPATSVKIVDVSTSAAPVVKSEIPVPANATASDVDALKVSTPAFNGTLLAVALVRCGNTAASNATERGVAYYDITDPANPVFKGRHNPDENFFLPSDPPCSLANSTRCASSNDNVSLVQRADGKVLSLSTEPFSSNSQTSAITGQPQNGRTGCGPPTSPTGCPYRGDVRIVDVTDPAAPTFLGSYPSAAGINNSTEEQRPPGFNSPTRFSFSNNGCRNYNAALSVGVQDGNRALVPYLDGGLFTTDITDPTRPRTIGRYAYPTDRALEGNAAYVDFATVGGRDLALVGENDWIGPESSLRIDGNSSVAGSKFACETMPTLFDPQNTAQIYRKPGSQVPGEIVYVGRGCPGDALSADLSRVNGKIAFRDQARNADREPAAGTPCSANVAVRRLQEAGAVGVVVGNTSPANISPQAVSSDGDPVEGSTDITIPVIMIDTGDANAVRDALCPVVAGGGGGCGAGAQTLSGAMVDKAGDWGALRVIDVTDPAAPALRGTYRPPGAKVFPPPDLGVYAVHHAVARGSTGFVAGHANGLRAVDLASADPKEIAAFVPPDTPDPTNSIPAEANVTGVDVTENDSIVISDVNSGLYVLKLRQDPGPPPTPTATPGPYVIPTPTATATPGPVARKRPGLAAKVRPRRDRRRPFRYRTRGRVKLPSGVSRRAGCRGKVRITVKRRGSGKTLSSRLAEVKRTCKFSSRVTFKNSKRFGKTRKVRRRGTLRFRIRFQGNARLKPRAITRTARYG